MKNPEDILTKSQKKLLRDQEEWMRDENLHYDEERTRLDAMYDIKKRFPTESLAREAVDAGGDPAVLYLRNKNKKVLRTKKASKPIVKCKCK